MHDLSHKGNETQSVSVVYRTLQVLLYVEAKQLDVTPTLNVKVSSCEKSLLSLFFFLIEEEKKRLCMNGVNLLK